MKVTDKLQVIILAAGKGKRMKASLPKVMHKVGGKSMAQKVVEIAKIITDDVIFVHSQDIIPHLPYIANSCTPVIQEDQLGTAHAVYVAKKYFNNHKNIIVLYADVPLINYNILSDFIYSHIRKKMAISTLAFESKIPNQYGRIITDEFGKFVRIIETSCANQEELKITLCNSGIMIFAPYILDKYIDYAVMEERINHNSNQKEFFLTDMIEICSNFGEKLSYYKTEKNLLLGGVNTQDDLIAINKLAMSGVFSKLSTN